MLSTLNLCEELVHQYHFPRMVLHASRSKCSPACDWCVVEQTEEQLTLASDGALGWAPSHGQGRKRCPRGGCGCTVHAHDDRTVRATHAAAGMACAARRGDGGRDVAVLPPGGVCPTAATPPGCPPAADHRRLRVEARGVGESCGPHLAPVWWRRRGAGGGGTGLLCLRLPRCSV